MPYGTLAAVKEHIGITNTTSDTELTNIQTDATRHIDMKLKPFTSTPLQTPLANELAQIENLMVAGRFRARRSSPTELLQGRHHWEVEADRRLDLFIEVNFQDTFTNVGDD